MENVQLLRAANEYLKFHIVHQPGAVWYSWYQGMSIGLRFPEVPAFQHCSNQKIRHLSIVKFQACCDIYFVFDSPRKQITAWILAKVEKVNFNEHYFLRKKHHSRPVYEIQLSEFHCGLTDTSDDNSFERPSEAIEKMWSLLADRGSHRHIWLVSIINDHLPMRKLSAKWVPFLAHNWL